MAGGATPSRAACARAIARVAIAPLMTWEERDFDETRLYHNTDMYVHI